MWICALSNSRSDWLMFVYLMLLKNATKQSVWRPLVLSFLGEDNSNAWKELKKPKFLFSRNIYFVPSIFSPPAQTVSVLLHRHRLPSGMYVWPHYTLRSLLDCHVIHFKKVVSCFSTRSWWSGSSWGRRWPDVAHGCDGMDSAGTCPIPASPI